MTEFELVDKIKEEFLSKLEHLCKLYVTIGHTTDESPMWLQYQGIDNRNKLLFRSSQRSVIGFSIDNPLDKPDSVFVMFNSIYKEFRNLKYSFIQENYPKVYEEIRKC